MYAPVGRSVRQLGGGGRALVFWGESGLSLLRY
jgi:hypothetical protein